MVNSGVATSSDSSRPHWLSRTLTDSQGSQDQIPHSRPFPTAEGTTGKVMKLMSTAPLELPGSQQSGKVSAPHPQCHLSPLGISLTFQRNLLERALLVSRLTKEEREGSLRVRSRPQERAGSGMEANVHRPLCKCSWIPLFSFHPPEDPYSPDSQSETQEDPTRKRDTEKTEKTTLREGRNPGRREICQAWASDDGRPQIAVDHGLVTRSRKKEGREGR